MASVRKTRTGRYELTVRHKDLPSGRKFFQFDDEQSATEWGNQWDSMVKAGIPIPPELLSPTAGKPDSTLAKVIRHWTGTGHVSQADSETLALLLVEVGATPMANVTYSWCENWIQILKLKQNLAPSTIRKRVGALSRAIDSHMRSFPDMPGLGNPLKLLPDGYSHYNAKDVALVTAAGKVAKVDQTRDRRLHPGEQEKIEAALRGEKRSDRQRALALPEGDALRIFFLFVIYTGARLKEALIIEWAQVDFVTKSIRLQTSKQRRGKVVFRVLPIRTELYPELLKHKANSDDTYLVFPFWNGAPEDMKKTSVRVSNRFSVLFDYAECTDITEHDLRHEATCRWFELRNADGSWMFRSEEINRLMGWSAGSTMAAKYASFRGEDLAARLWA